MERTKEEAQADGVEFTLKLEQYLKKLEEYNPGIRFTTQNTKNYVKVLGRVKHLPYPSVWCYVDTANGNILKMDYVSKGIAFNVTAGNIWGGKQAVTRERLCNKPSKVNYTKKRPSWI